MPWMCHSLTTPDQPAVTERKSSTPPKLAQRRTLEPRQNLALEPSWVKLVAMLAHPGGTELGGFRRTHTRHSSQRGRGTDLPPYSPRLTAGAPSQNIRAMNRHEGDPPRPIDGGSSAQTVVHYVGLRRGAMGYRGRGSGRRYAFDRDECCGYVLDEDLEFFRLRPDFIVYDGDDSHIDPALERARAEREQLRAQVAQDLMIKLSPYLPRQDAPRKPSRSGLGRPPIPDAHLRLLNHLREHVFPRWPIKQLALEFARDAIDPESTIKKRLERARKRRPSLGDCEYCRDNFDPPPPRVQLT